MEWGNYVGQWLPYCAGFLFALIGGDLAANAALRHLYAPAHERRLSGRAIGLLERVIYASGPLLGLLSVVGIWLALKVAGSWKHLEGEKDPPKGRDLFNNYLTGNGISLIYGVVGGQSIVWWQAGRTSHSVTIPVALVLGTACFVAWLKLQQGPGGRAAASPG